MATPPPQQPPQGFGPPPGMVFQGPQPTPEQIAELQRKLAEDAQKAGMSVPEFIEQIKRQQFERMRAMQAAAQQQQMMQQQMMQQRQQQMGQQQQGQHDHQHGENCNHPHPHQHPHQHAQGQQQPIQPGPPKPEGLAMAKFLRGQNLKPRTVILNGERKDMFRVKRALRALQSPAYEKARKKNPVLPAVTDRASLENAFKLLPLSMLALRIAKIEPQLGPNGKKPKRVKGQWNVRIEQQQDAGDDMYYIWLYEGSQVMRQVYAALALVIIFAVVLYPLWPYKLRQGVYYLSWGMLGLLGLFFAMAIFRVILFCITYFVVPPGLWLYPNLWEDVSFMDSFRPVWAWHQTEKPKKKKRTKSISVGAANPAMAAVTGQVNPVGAVSTGTDTQINVEPRQRHYEAPRVEELGDDE